MYVRTYIRTCVCASLRFASCRVSPGPVHQTPSLETILFCPLEAPCTSQHGPTAVFISLLNPAFCFCILRSHLASLCHCSVVWLINVPIACHITCGGDCEMKAQPCMNCSKSSTSISCARINLCLINWSHAHLCMYMCIINIGDWYIHTVSLIVQYILEL